VRKVCSIGAPELARAWGCDASHFTSGARRRPHRALDLYSAASCHHAAESTRGALGFDFAVLGPVLADADARGDARARMDRLRAIADDALRSSRWAITRAARSDRERVRTASRFVARAWRAQTSTLAAERRRGGGSVSSSGRTEVTR
jgi:hypothetical protein